MTIFHFTIFILSSTTMARCLHGEVDLVDRLNDFFGFDHNIFFLDARADHNRYFPTSNKTSTPQTVYIFDVNHLDTNVVQTTPITLGKNNFLIVVADSLKSGTLSRLLTHAMEMCQLDSNVKIGVFFTHIATSVDIIEELLGWSSGAGVGNIFSAFHVTDDSFNVLRVSPFGPFVMINVTVSDSVQNCFPDKNLPNYYKHPIRLVKAVDEWDVSKRLYQDNKFWDTFVEVINASILIIPKTQSVDSIVGDFELNTSNKGLNIRVGPYRMESGAVIVPHAKPCSSVTDYLQNAAWKRLIVYTSIVIASSSTVLIVSGYLRNKKVLLLQSVTEVVNLLMNDNGAIKYGERHRADVCVIVPITFTGLIVVNGILSVLQSYLTLPIYERQINSIEDLYKSSILIMEDDIYWTDAHADTLDNLTNYGGWRAKFVGTNHLHLRESLLKFNSSVAYISGRTDADAMAQVQLRLNLKEYHTIEHPLPKIPWSYKPLRNLPIIDHMNEIIHRFQSAGLLDKWRIDGTRKWVVEVYNENIAHPLVKISDDQSNVGKFSMMSILWLGWISSFIVFICEIIWNKTAWDHWDDCLRI